MKTRIVTMVLLSFISLYFWPDVAVWPFMRGMSGVFKGFVLMAQVLLTVIAVALPAGIWYMITEMVQKFDRKAVEETSAPAPRMGKRLPR